MAFKYFKIPNPETTLNYDCVSRIMCINGEYYVELNPGFVKHESWQELSEIEFESLIPLVTPSGESRLETTEQKLARVEEQNIILMDALATTFEEVLALRGIVEGGTGA